MNLSDIIEARRNDWIAAYEALSAHFRAHEETRSWHPLGRPERLAADTHSRREYERLVLAEALTKKRLASAMRWSGYQPVSAGMYRPDPRVSPARQAATRRVP